MKKLALVGLALAVAMGISGCAPAAEAGPTPSPTASGNGIDPSLIPAQATADLPMVDPAQYLTTGHDYVFKIGESNTFKYKTNRYAGRSGEGSKHGEWERGRFPHGR